MAGKQQTAPRRPALGMDDPGFTAPASRGEQLKSCGVGRQGKRGGPAVYLLVHQRLVRQHLLPTHGRTDSTLHFLPALPKATTALLKELSCPEHAGVQTHRTETLGASSSQLHLHQRRCSSTSHSANRSKRSTHSLHLGPRLEPQSTTSTSCPARGGTFPHVHLFERKKLSNSSKMKTSSSALHTSGRLHYPH